MTYKSEAPPIFIGGLETFWFDLHYSNRENGSPTFRNWDATRNEPLYEHVTRLAKFYDFESGWALGLSERCSSGEEFIDLFMAEYANKHGKKRWVEKLRPMFYI